MRYSSPTFFWEFARIGQRIFTIIVFAFFKDFTTIKGTLALIFVIVYGLMSFRLKPDYNTIVRKTDLYSTVVQVFSLIMALFLYQNIFKSLQYIALIPLSGLNLMFVLFIMLKIIQSYKEKLLFDLKDIPLCKGKNCIKNFENSMERRKFAIRRWKAIRRNIGELNKIMRD